MNVSLDTIPVRCAVYTRKSTEEGLDQDFNSLEAQRESAEAFVASQRHEGWRCFTRRYDDGGFTGGNAERPALKKLLADVAAGEIDCVVVYKVDRLSRSLLDFVQIMALFDTHDVSFVSVTQQFNTTSSMGRLTLNILLSFAQFERELIGERTRDKMGAARRKGKYCGGVPVLGYDVDRERKRLIVDKAEAERVRTIFALYLERESLLDVVAELDERGWRTKAWTAKAGKTRGGVAFTKTGLRTLLTNVTYVGRVRHRGEVHPGEHDGIVDPDVFERVQRLLRLNSASGGPRVADRYGAVLKGLLWCGGCHCRMTPSHTKKGQAVYRYYHCVGAQKRGWSSCPGPSLPASEIEAFVVEQVKEVRRDPDLVAATLAEARRQTDERLAELALEAKGLKRELTRRQKELRTLTRDKLADLDTAIARAEHRLAEIRTEEENLQTDLVTETEVAGALADCEPLWSAMTPTEQAKTLALLVERVTWDGAAESVSIDFTGLGLRLLNHTTNGETS